MIASARLQTWNYGSSGMYFITICTGNREFYFGEIINAQMQLSELGSIAQTEWIKTVELRPDMNLELGEFVVMTNHMHGIILIGKNQYNTGDDGDIRRMPTKPVIQTNQKNLSINLARNPKNLGSILRGYKSAVTSFARKHKIQFDWQARFHDHIIRSMDEYYRISNYIINNPANWRADKFYK